MAVETAVFAAGCFWGVEDAFMKVNGVLKTEVGFTGGEKPDPTYADVCAGDTGHAESVKVDFDPFVVSYAQLLDIFWNVHDPTTQDRQGPDVGRQYRSAIFCQDEQQKKLAEWSMRDIQRSGRFRGKTIVTEILMAGKFYPAEEIHQKHFRKTGEGACHLY